MCPMLIIMTPETRQYLRSGVFIVNFEHVIASWEMMIYGRKFLNLKVSIRS